MNPELRAQLHRDQENNAQKQQQFQSLFSVFSTKNAAALPSESALTSGAVSAPGTVSESRVVSGSAPTTAPLRLGIMGGTFDPIHYGHLVTAETVRSLFSFQAVVFIPTGIPPHKENQRITAARHRCAMTLLATGSNPYFWVSIGEIERSGYSYTIDTVAEIAEQVSSSVELYFITGADAVLEILYWKKARELTELCTLVAATRPGYDLSAPGLEEKIPEDLRQRIEVVQVPSLAIASTDIRQRIQRRTSVRYLVPDWVRVYMIAEGLYRK